MSSRRGLIAAALLLTVSACGTADGASEADASADAAPVMAAAELAELPPIIVYKTEGCGCCNGWVEHLQAAGFEVDARNVRDLMSVKLDAGVPADLSSCHTALVDGYVVEGHVPAHVVKRMLAERPEATGIAVPGMPVGSPGMEGANPKPYEVQVFDRQGGRTVYAEVDPR
jgi:hypothetical protein